jgi:tetratricopeptide (TPR) repeat protein
LSIFILDNAGCYQRHFANFAESKNCFERALEIDEKALELEHTSVAIRVNNLGSVLQALGDLAGAKRCFKRSIRILQKFQGDDHPLTKKAKANLNALNSQES